MSCLSSCSDSKGTGLKDASPYTLKYSNVFDKCNNVVCEAKGVTEEKFYGTWTYGTSDTTPQKEIISENDQTVFFTFNTSGVEAGMYDACHSKLA